MSLSRSSRRSITRVGASGGTGKTRSRGSDHPSATALIRLPSRVMHRRVPSARCSATRTAPSQASLAPFEPLASEARSSLARTFAAWPNEWSFPHRSAALMGFGPSQVCSRIGWDRISAIPDPRAVRATPLHPIDFRRADRARRVGYLIEPEKASGSGVLWRSTSGLRSRLRSAPAVIVATGHVPALGFASCRVGGHEYSCIRRASTPVRIIDPRRHPTRSASRLSALGLGRSFSTLQRVGELPPNHAKVEDGSSPSFVACPSAS
jgi:hypothetical protein